MTAALSGEQLTLLERFVQRTRSWIEDDLASTLEGKFGIHLDGEIEALPSLTLRNAQLAIRTDLVELVDYLRAEGEGERGSVERLVREAAFTHTNRLIAVRVAEAIGLLPETMSHGISSSGFRDFSELAPIAAETDWGRFALFVRLCADELAGDVPALFDPRNPLLELDVSEAVLTRVVESMQELPSDIWGAPDALGWAYQFFNTGEERREMRESSAPRNSRELAVRNQFFTKSYVVEFLVQNGLGAHLATGYPALVDDLPLLVEIPTERADVDLERVSVLDPACGSGHFLLGAYDVLERAWQLAGVDPEAAAPHIVRSLWGIDIDPRAAQIAQAAVMFRARRHCRSARLPASNVICARALPLGPQAEELIDTLPDRVARAVRRVAAELTDAPVLGPLLKIEERLGREVRDVFGTGVLDGTLPEIESTAEDVESAVLTALRQIADSTTSSAAQRLFVAEAHEAVHFVEAMVRRYTAVLMNPPFGEPVPSTKDYLKAAYPWIPARTRDLLTAFVGRGLELAEPGVGTCGAITSRAGLFLSTFAPWRERVLLHNDLRAVADLGYGVMEQALVEAAAYVIRRRPAEGSTSFLRLLRATDRPAAMAALAVQSRSGADEREVFRIPTTDLSKVPGSPFAYWVPSEVRDLFDSHPPLGGQADVKQGLATGDDFRYVRTIWEIPPERRAATRAETRTGKRWVAFAKGGEYSPYWSDISLVVDWKDDGQSIRNNPAARPQNLKFYFKPGLTWTLRTASAFGARILPSGCIFSNKGNIICGNADLLPVLLWLNSRLGAALLALQMPAADETTSGGASKSYEVGTVARVPTPSKLTGSLSEIASRMIEIRRSQRSWDERSPNFAFPQLRIPERPDYSDDLELIELSAKAEEILLRTVAEDTESLRQFLDEEVGPHPSGYPPDVLDVDRLSDLLRLPMQSLISGLIEEHGGSRAIASLSYIGSRRLEVIAHGEGVHPRAIADAARATGTFEPGYLEDTATRIISYLVGVAFGRWDIRKSHIEHYNEEDPYREVVTYQPGLAHADGSVAQVQRVLVDDSGPPNSLWSRVEAAADQLPPGSSPLDHVLGLLGKGESVGRYLRHQFFAEHLAMYTESRRKAPIYWQLQVPSKKWGLWLYAPEFSREVLFEIVREVEKRQRLADQQIAHLQGVSTAGGGEKSASSLAKELETEQKLAVELASFRAEAERIANLGWEPDLDDGMVLNAAPLADLFPAWKDAAVYRKELRAGKYEWATVARYADRL
jgi:SAM-dependent methyltransferase